MDFIYGDFVWNVEKEAANVEKHGMDFAAAVNVFRDPWRKIFVDSKHSYGELRMFCIGKIEGRIVTVRFVRREGKIRIFGAGFWRNGEKYYEKKD